MRQGDEPLVIGRGTVKVSTAKAILFTLEDGREVWVPKSCLHDDHEITEEYHPEGDIVVKTWWANKNGYG